MGDLLTREKLRELGFQDAEPGAMEHVEPSPSTTGEALGVREAIVLSALLTSAQGPTNFLPAESASLRAQGASVAFLHENLNIVRVQTLGGEDMFVKAAGPGVGQPESDRGSVYWDTSQTDSLILILPTGVVALERRANGIDVQAAETITRARPLAALNAPLEDWAAECSDVWLSTELKRCSGIGGSWHAVVGAGMLARLFEREDVPGVAFSVHATQQTQLWQQPRIWARTLSNEQRETIQDLALTEIDALQAALDSRPIDTGPGIATLQQEWLAVCHRRDDVASAFVVLAEAGAPAAKVQHGLVFLDRRGRRALFNVPRNAVAEDERLRRIRLIDPTAWWGSPEDFEDVL